jgi:dTDP-L-rhamnose 4-epimerase
MRILLTGGAGFIGTHIAADLADRGDDVWVLDCLHPAAHGPNPDPDAVRTTLDSKATFVYGDVRDRSLLDSVLPGIDAVIHQAAMVGMGINIADMPDYVACNDLGTATLLSAMASAQVRRLILASSMVVYGEGAYECSEHGAVRPGSRETQDLEAGMFEPRCPRCRTPLIPGRVNEDAPLSPRSVYAATKVAQEHLTGSWAHATGSRAIALRYHNVYGPRMPQDTPYAGVAAIFRSALERGIAPHVFEDGRQRRDFIHVADVAQANLAALDALSDDNGGATKLRSQSEPAFRAYNVATGRPRTVMEMAAALAGALNGPPPIVTGDFRAGDVRHIVASPIRATRDLGFAATTEFAAGVAAFAEAPLRRTTATRTTGGSAIHQRSRNEQMR